ncbi:hypothetical protein E2A64_03915 [Pseudohoeflea suaedae]|uniref:Flagellar assembly protein FliH/Type III secretion system HrpE domain-containing protein n=1 Tax=Pseudohoeflea suaedae TaxID=877384 RepID=A0A4R5PMS6_9HYPH|nr:hypothetical protein [Pseudohoeflea suaedae]TDH38273.1 hypothetical protein E2A64_03915 [Pseudohoeflea suaedae]
MSLALAQLLPEFDMPARARAIPDAVPQAPREVEKRRDPDPSLIEAIREEARAEGRMEAERELAMKHATELADMEAEHARAMAAREVELLKTVAEAFPAAIAERADGLAARLSDEVARILEPLVEDQLRRNMVEALAAEIRDALDMEAAERISVTGPAIWLDLVQAVLAEKAGSVTFTEAARADVEVVIDETRLRSRFDALAQTFGKEAP